MPLRPEQRAREGIDRALEESGWILQNRDELNLAAGPGVAVREFRMAAGHGYADYLLFVEGKAVGALEAKPAGYRLINVEIQVATVGQSRLARLRQSILKAAFEGKLVDQDPTDEPASELLARIRAEREAAPKPKPRQRRSMACR